MHIQFLSEPIVFFGGDQGIKCNVHSACFDGVPAI